MSSETHSPPQTRDIYWDGIRGLLILTVIWIHVPSGADFQDTAASWNFDYWLNARQVLNFPVAFFLFLAGYFVNHQRPAAPWLATRLPRLLIPFAVWSLLYGLIAAAKAGTLGDPVEFFVEVGSGLTAVHLYFIIVLVQLTLLTPLLVRVLRTRWAWVPLLITPLYVAWLYFSSIEDGQMPDGYATVFMGWFAFYFAGMWFRGREASLPTKKTMLLVVVVALAASIIEAHLLIATGSPVRLAVTQIGATSIVYTFAIIGLVLVLKSSLGDHTPRWLGRLGGVSYGVYFVHMVWVGPLKRAAERVLDVYPVLPLIQLVVLVIAVLLSVASIWLTQWIIGDKAASFLFGFQRPPRAVPLPPVKTLA